MLFYVSSGFQMFLPSTRQTNSRLTSQLIAEAGQRHFAELRFAASFVLRDGWHVATEARC